MYAKTLVTFCGLASLASAHMKMNTPVPYGQSTLNNGPLLADGSDFPCKQRAGVYQAEGASNVYSLGSTNALKFTGQAVHGGGSCQVSITYDANPTKNSVWKVIKSIEGGCPARGEAGNMGDNANAADPYEYDFTIPSNIPAGNGTIAWTWFNKIGNREMYMNCGPVTLTGSGGSEASFNALPDMFTANINNGCGTPDSTDLLFPNPGSDVEQLNGATSAFAKPTGNCQAASGGNGGGSGGGATPPKPTSVPAVKPTSAPVAKPTNTLPGGVFITVGTTKPAVTAAPAPTESPEAPADAAPTPAPAPSAPVAAPVPDTGSGSGSGGAMAVGTACSSEGMWNCVGGTGFQRCASGVWSPIQQLAAGTSCKAGQSSEFTLITKRGQRRALRFRA